MRIAFVVTDLSNVRIGGISRVATDVGAGMVRQGHQVVAYVLGRKGNDRPREHRGIELRYIEPFRNLNDFHVRAPLPDRIIDPLALAGAFEGLDEQKWDLIPEVCNA